LKFDKEGNVVLGTYNYKVNHLKWWKDEIDESIKEKLELIKKLNLRFCILTLKQIA